MGAAFYVTSEAEPRRAETVLIADGDDGHRPARPGVISAGYPSISDMLASSPFFVAHRGGSENWDEMTMRAYTNAVAWGAGALEVSLARTSDDVYFGLHDEYLDRVSLNSPNGTTLNPKSMTWAQVQQYDVFGREPFMRLEEVAAAYGDTHVFLIDPKFIDRHNSTSRDRFFNKVKALFPDWQTRVVIKLFWGFNSDWGAAAKAAGFTTWGYLWDNDGLSQLANASNRANFDWLGFNYDASEGDWSTVLSWGKPVIGHVCPDAAAANAALSKGAVGVMAAGVKQIIPPKGPWA